MRKALEQTAAVSDAAREKGAVLRSEVCRANLEVAPHGAKAVLAPPDAGAAAKSQKGPAKAGAGAGAMTASATAAGTTKAQSPTVVNVPESPEHVFQEVDYYSFPQSSAVRSAEAAAASVVDLAPAPAAPAAGIDAEMRAKVYDLEMRLNDYERRLYYMYKYTEKR